MSYEKRGNELECSQGGFIMREGRKKNKRFEK